MNGVCTAAVTALGRGPHTSFRLFPIAYEILLLILAIFKSSEHWKLNGFHGSRLIFVLVRDQAMYFMMCATSRGHALYELIDASFSAICVVVFIIIGDKFELDNSLIMRIIFSLGNPAFLSILGSRMFFNLKEAAEHGVNVGTNRSSYSQSDIQFDESHGGENL